MTPVMRQSRGARLHSIRMDQLARRNRYLRFAGGAMIAAAGIRAVYAAWFEPGLLAKTPDWALKWTAAYVVFILAYALMPGDRSTQMTRRDAWLVTAQTLSGL